MADGKKHAILRWINYKNADMNRLKECLEYICDNKSSPLKYQKGYWFREANPLQGIEVVHNRWNPKGCRIFKHGIFSFGIPELTAEKALLVSDEVLQYYAKNYPVLLCIHTNIPKRIHGHFCMIMTNAKTGKKFEQGPREFENFRNHFNSVMLKNGLRPLKGADVVAAISNTKMAEPVYHDEISFEPVNTCVLQSVVDGNVPSYYSSSPWIRAERQSEFYVDINCDMTQVTREVIDGIRQIKLMKRGL